MQKKSYSKKTYWQNIETGELLTYKQMIDVLVNEYDLNDPTNMFEVFDYFKPTTIKIN